MSYIISIDDLVTTCNISEVIDANKIESIIKVTEDFYIKSLLGRNFYVDLINQLKNNNEFPGSLSDDYIKLLNGDDFFSGLKIWFCWCGYTQYLHEANFSSTQSGIKTFNDNTSTKASESLISAYIQSAQQKADHYKGELINFLTNNESLYPLYEMKVCDKVKRNRFISGIKRNIDIRDFR